jgi:hypothetical protein
MSLAKRVSPTTFLNFGFSIRNLSITQALVVILGPCRKILIIGIELSDAFAAVFRVGARLNLSAIIALACTRYVWHWKEIPG